MFRGGGVSRKTTGNRREPSRTMGSRAKARRELLQVLWRGLAHKLYFLGARKPELTLCSQSSGKDSQARDREEGEQIPRYVLLSSCRGESLL